jgi:hypothetical protein
MQDNSQNKESKLEEVVKDNLNGFWGTLLPGIVLGVPIYFISPDISTNKLYPFSVGLLYAASTNILKSCLGHKGNEILGGNLGDAIGLGIGLAAGISASYYLSQ